MKTVMLSTTDQKFHNATHKCIITYTDVAALGAATTGVIELVPNTAKYASTKFAAGTQFAFVKSHLITAFDASDAAINSLLVEVGITGGDTDAYLSQTELAADGSYVTFNSAGAVTQPDNENTADTLDALFTVAGGGSPLLSEITSGEVHLYIKATTPQSDMQAVTGVVS